jgi:hypothetical protein
MNISYNREKNLHTCMVCGREFRSYNSAYQHIKRAHENHPSMQTNREGYSDQIPSAPLFPHNEQPRYEPEYHEPSYHEPVHHNPEYYEPVRHERVYREERDAEKEEKDAGGAIIVFFLGLIAVGVFIYLKYFRNSFSLSGLLGNDAADEDGDVEPAFRVNNSVPVTKDGAYPVFNVRGEA